ncbi:NAD-dependent epimerase/dehydratase family protein [Bacteroidota bacterium]
MILVTGGTGLLGGHLLFDLIKNGESVRAIKRNSSDISITKKIFSYYSTDYENLFSKIEWKNADILDVDSLYEAFEGVDLVYHCAAFVSFDHRDKKEVIKNNIDGTVNIVNVCLTKKIKKLCHVSSVAALGDDPFMSPKNPVNENTIRDQTVKHTSYSISKYKSELEVWRGINEGLNAVIVNPSVILGPGNWKNGSSLIFYKAWKGLIFYTSGINGFVDVRDTSEIMIKLMKSDISAERFCVNAENIRFKEFFDILSDNFGKKRPYIYVGRFLSGLVWRMELLRCLISGSKPIITKDAASAAVTKVYYSSEKTEKTLNFVFRPVREIVKDYAKFFLQDFK